MPMKLIYMPRPVSEFLDEEAQRLENDKRIVKDFQRRQAEQRAYKLHSLTLPWAITLIGLAAAGFCYLVKANHWWDVR